MTLEPIVLLPMTHVAVHLLLDVADERSQRVSPPVSSWRKSRGTYACSLDDRESLERCAARRVEDEGAEHAATDRWNSDKRCVADALQLASAVRPG